MFNYYSPLLHAVHSLPPTLTLTLTTLPTLSPSPSCSPTPSFSLFLSFSLGKTQKCIFGNITCRTKILFPIACRSLSLSSCSSPRCLCASAMGHVRVPHRPLLLRVLRVHRPVLQPQPSIPEPIDFIDFRHRCGRLLDPRQVTPGPPHPSHTHTHPIPSLLCLPYLLPASSHRPTLSCLPNEK